jgi:hypothetical protein
VQVLLALAKALDPTGKVLPKWRADNTNNWCKEWLASQGCDSKEGRLTSLDISQAGLKAAAPLQGNLPQQLPPTRKPLDLFQLTVSGRGITGTLPIWILQVAKMVAVTNTSITGPLPSLPAAAGAQPVMAASSLRIIGNPNLSGTLPASWVSALAPATFITPELDLSNNAFTGTIPAAWSTINAEQINLAGNKLSGDISRAWAREYGVNSLKLLNISGNAGMKGCLADAQGQPWESLPFIDARGTQLLDCIKRQPALTKFGSGMPGWSPASCGVAGYVLKARQLPIELSSQRDVSQQVLLYTIKPPNAMSRESFGLGSLAETSAACDALDACVMFTSDGYLIGAYRSVTNVTELKKMLELEQQLGPWLWQPMTYCPGKCCGTWASTRFDTETLAAVGASTQAQPGSSQNASALARPPGVASEGAFSPYGVDPSSERCAATRAGAASSFTCPPRCRVACCAEEGVYFAVKMSNHPFWQCSVQACMRSCGFELTFTAAESVTYTQKIVALYLAQKSKGRPPKASGIRKTGGFGGCTGSLC